MAKKLKNDPAQLQLDFAAARDNLVKATEAFEKVAQQYLDLHSDNPETKEAVTDEAKEMRRAIGRLVGIIAAQSPELDWHQAWLKAYDELCNLTGYHAVVASGGKGTHLDCVERDGRMKDLHTAVSGLVQKKAPGNHV